MSYCTVGGCLAKVTLLGVCIYASVHSLPVMCLWTTSLDLSVLELEPDIETN